MSNMISVPQGGQVGDYQGLMSRIPDTDVPASFGLPANIDRSVQRFNSNQVIN